MATSEPIGPELPEVPPEIAILRDQVKRYENEIMRLRGLADELSWALAKVVLNGNPPKG